jgi:hypothetical protein
MLVQLQSAMPAEKIAQNLVIVEKIPAPYILIQLQNNLFGSNT